MQNFSATLKPQNSKPFPLALILILALSFALNLHGLAADSFWGDEIFTASFASRPIPEVLRWTAEDIHPPLYYLIARTFTGLTVPLGLTTDPTAASDWLWRFPSVMAVVLTVAVTYRIAWCVLRSAYNQTPTTHYAPRRIESSRFTIVSTAAALLLALAPIALKYGQEARMHALFMFCAALSTWLLFRALAWPQQWHRWLAYTLALTATIYTMYFGFLILAAHIGFWILDLGFWIYHLRFTKSKSPISNLQLLRTTHYALLTRFSLATLLTGLLYLPWWPVLFNLLRHRAAVGAIEGGVGDPLTFITGVVQALGPQPTPVAWGFLALFITGLIVLARQHWPLAAFGALWLALPVALPIVLGDPRALQFRYAFILPIYLTVIAVAVTHLSQQIVRLMSIIPQSPNLLSPISKYLLWLLATLSFIASLGLFAQTKPNWRAAAAYLTEQTQPADLIIIAPLWDEGRFLEYYYRGPAPLLTPAALVTNIQGRAEGLRAGGGKIWVISRFAPAESPAAKNIEFSGVVLAEPQVPVYEPELLAGAALDLANQAVEAAYPWAAAAEAQGVLNPDPRTAQAVALRALGDTWLAAGRPQEALAAYQRAVDIFPGWVNGYLALAETQEAVGNLAAAAQAYQQAVAFNLAWQGALADEAARLIAEEQWPAAIETYHRLMKD